MSDHRLALLAISAISFALLVDEIMLSAIFHVLLGAGNTVAAIAIALAGLSASGIVAYSVPALHDPERASGLLRGLVFGFAVSLLASVYAIMAIPIHHGDLVYHHADPAVQLWKIATYHITVVPFFLGGLTIAVLFRSEPSRIGWLYFVDLMAAAAACIVSPALLSGFGAPGAILLAAVPAALLGSYLIAGRRAWRMALVAIPAVLLVAGLIRPQLLSFSRINTMGEVSALAYRSIPIEEGDIEFEKWALDAWTIIRSDQMPQQWENFRGWGLSPRYRGVIPETILINYNARFSTYVTRRDGDAKALAEWIDADISTLHHLIGRQYDEVLNIGAGGGRETLAALQHGAKHVVAVDVSSVVVEDIMKGRLREFSGELYLDPRVEAIADEGRSFAERSTSIFDLIEFSIVGGMNLEKMDLVRVDDLFTREALETYLRRLDGEGVFSYVMYSTRSDIVSELASAEGPPAQPYIPALRTLAGLRLALEDLDPGIQFSDHVLVAALPKMVNPRYDLVHIIVSRRPFTSTERERFRALCERNEFLALHPSGPTAAESVNLYRGIATSPTLAALASEIPFSIWPATDDRPFQYALDTAHLLRALERGELIGLLWDNPLVSLALGIGSLVLVLSFAPLIVSQRRMENLRTFRSHWSMLLYFACIGFAYMGVEIAALLRLQSFLGKPIYGLSVGLFSFLLASGLGSAFSNRVQEVELQRSVTRIVVALVLSGACFAAGSSALFSVAASSPLAARVGIAIATIFVPAFLMGMLFPIGIRLLARDGADLIPWAWAINGCFCVLGIFSTRSTALLFGCSRALGVGLCVYLLVIVCVQLYSLRSAEGRAPGSPPNAVGLPGSLN